MAASRVRGHDAPHHDADYRARVARVSSVRSDLRLILWIQALRAFVYGFGVVVLGVALARSGLSDAAVTLVFTAMLAGMAAFEALERLRRVAPGRTVPS